jgi:hypothetical protein
MPGKPVYALVAAAVLSLASCTTDDLPLIGKPAARMDGHTISMSDYQTRLRLLRDEYNAKRNKTPSQYPALDSDKGKLNENALAQQAIKDLADQQVILDDAGRHGIAVSDDDVNKDVDNARKDYEFQVSQAKLQGGQSAPTFNDYLKKEGVSIDQVRDQARARLAEQRLENQLAKKRATEALGQIKSGKDLVEVAKTYSDEKGSDRGSELTLRAADLDTGSLAQVKSVLQQLQPGQTSQSLTHANDGFYIFKMDARDGNDLRIRYVLVRAPDPDYYHTDQRPQWFADYVMGLERGAHVHYYVANVPSP